MNEENIETCIYIGFGGILTLIFIILKLLEKI